MTTTLFPPEEEEEEEIDNEEDEEARLLQQLQPNSWSVNSSTTPLPATSVATLSLPWQYDDSHTACFACAVAFHALQRRHHCRLCGNIFCHPCTVLRALIPPASIVLVPRGGKKAKPHDYGVSFSPADDPDRMLTYVASGASATSSASSPVSAGEILYGKGLEERFLLAREPLRVCQACFHQLAPLQDDLRSSNSNAVRYNYIDPTDPQRLFNSPLAFTLGHEIRKAAYTLNNLLPLPKRLGSVLSAPPLSSSSLTSLSRTNVQQCKDTCLTLSPNLGDLDGVRIPARLLEQAKGVAVLTVVKTGLGLAGVEFGTGLVVARVNSGVSSSSCWSAPSAIGMMGVSWGALLGAQLSDHVFLLMTDDAVELLFHDTGSVQLGADVGIALGPLGRAAEADFGAAPGKVAPIYTYSLSKGLYAGVSLDGKAIVTRKQVNERFYGRTVSSMEILQGAVPTPPAAQPLYEALQRCHVYATNVIGARPAKGSLSHASVPSLTHDRVVEHNMSRDDPDQRLQGEYGELVPGGADQEFSNGRLSDSITPVTGL